MGANRLDKSGSSVGWALVMSLRAVMANLWGLSTGEWRRAGGESLRVMSAGLTILGVARFLVRSGIK